MGNLNGETYGHGRNDRCVRCRKIIYRKRVARSGFCRANGSWKANCFRANCHEFYQHPVAFVCSPWQEIYRKDNERSHDFEFAKRDYDANCKAYSNAGYELIEVPKLSIEERADFVLENMAL